MTLYQEDYRYAVPGIRSVKHLQTGSRQQQVRYLPELELRNGTTAQPLRVIAAGHGRIYREGNHALTHFNLCDRLGSVSGVVNVSGSLVSQEIGYPFGGTACWLTGAEAGAAVKFQRYCGKERDATGLIFYGWRYFAPWKMRWLNSDPAGAIDGLNLFRMVGNNPLTLADRDGRLGEDPPVATTQETADMVQRQSRPSVIVSQPQPVIQQSVIVSPNNNPQKTQVPPLPSFQDTDLPQASTSAGAPIAAPATRADSLTCLECGKQLTTHKNLKRHAVVHQDRQYECDFPGCGKIFKHNFLLTRHKQIHTTVKAFKCDWPGCHSSFKTSGNLNQHKKIHEPGITFSCSVPGCNKIFPTQYSFNKHTKRGHVATNPARKHFDYIQSLTKHLPGNKQQ